MSEVILGGEAVAAGYLTRHELSRRYTTIYRGVYVPNDVDVSLRDRAIAAWLASKRKGVVAGSAAAALHGAPWSDTSVPIELLGVHIKAQRGLTPRTERAGPDEITRIAGLPVTTRVRTAFDIGRHLDRPAALARLDALMWRREFSIDEVFALADRYPRARGLKQLRELLPLVDGGAQTPGESVTRLWLHDAGLPPPQTQIAVLHSNTVPMTWLAMGWPEYKVAVEYHDRNGRPLRVEDIARLRMLEALGWIVIRVTADDAPGDVVAKVETALIHRGCLLEISDLQRFTRTLAA